MNAPLPPRTPAAGSSHDAAYLPPPAAGPPSVGAPGGAYRSPDPEPTDVGDVSVGDLISNVTRDLSTLMRQELALAQAELKQEASKTAKGAGAMAGAGVAGHFVLLFLSLALWAGLSNVMDAGWAGLIVAVIWAVIAAVLFASGRTKLRQVHPTPDRTVETLSQVPDALKGSRGGNP
jgi:Putative Actinobacterial Holin-X, holin superfamily III